jgi:hypothetical protein
MIKKYLRLRFIMGRGNGHISFFTGTVFQGMAVLVFLKTYNIPSWLIFALVPLDILASFIVGYLDVHRGWFSEDLTIANERNRELMAALKKD